MTAVKKKTAGKDTRARGKKKAGAAGRAAKAGGRGRKKPSFNEVMREKLLEERKRLLSDVSAKVRKESELQQGREIGDIYDLASDERERELSLTLGDRERRKLADIDLALERIQEGTYGVCEECGEPVGEKRLEVLPFTRVCVDCQARLEREQKVAGTVEEEGMMRIIEKSETDIDTFH